MLGRMLPLLATSMLLAQPVSPAPATAGVPSCQIAGAPNPAFAAQLKDVLQALAPPDRKPFFKAPRAKQRELQQRIFEVERGLQQAQSLRNTLEREGASNVSQAQVLVGFRLSTVAFFRSLGGDAKP